jgi:hypothetical protein
MRIALVTFLVLLSLAALGQRIDVYKTFGGVIFERDSESISIRQVQSILSSHPEANKLFKKARTNSAIASVLGFTGGILIGVPLGTALVGGDPEWGLAAAGAATILASIPFNLAFQRKTVEALDLYNQQYPSSRSVEGEFFLGGSQVGLRLRF